jgi:hypothetical protein
MPRKHKKYQDEKSGEKFPGYPHTPVKEDVFNNQSVEPEVDPENTKKQKDFPEPVDGASEKIFDEDVSGSDLDIPGSELDDAQENVGSEDEENNYYSLGGDEKEQQEENTGKE